MSKHVAKQIAASIALGIFACAGGCFLAPHDSERKPTPPIDGFVIYWTVVDEGSGAELTRGCGRPADQWKKVQFKAAVGSRVTETVLFERVEKEPGSDTFFPNFMAEDAFWCSKERDVLRSPYEFKQDIHCAQPSPERPPANILSRELIHADSGMGGYRFGLEIIGTGSLMYKYDPNCAMSRGTEFSVLDP